MWPRRAWWVGPRLPGHLWCHRAVAKKHRNRSARRSPHRTATRQARPPRPRGPQTERLEDLDLFQTLRRALRSEDPTAFLLTAAPIAQVVAEGTVDENLPEGWVGLLDSFCEVDVAETTALLHVIAALSPDELVRARLRRVLDQRRQPVPGHLRTLDQLRVDGTMIMGGDPAGDNIITGLAWPTGEAMTLVTYLAREPDVYLKDAFVIGDSLSRVVAHFRDIAAADGHGPQLAPRELDPAEARAAIERGLRGHDAMPDAPRPDDEVQQWPMCRTLVEHVVTLLPTGGQGYDEHRLLPGQELMDLPPGREDWEEAEEFDLAPLVEDFFGSRHARRLPDDEDTTTAVLVLLTLAAAAEDDPVHWCANVLEWVLTETLATDPILDDEVVERCVDVLPALMAWAGEVSGEDPQVARTLARMVPVWAEQMWQLRRDPEMARARAELGAQLALLGGDDTQFYRLVLETEVGGAQALAALDEDPLPAEELALERLPQDVHERALEVDEALTAALAGLADPHLDAEFLTACRRFFARAVETAPAVLRRRARADTTAAAVAWTVGRANLLVGYSPAPVRTGDLMDAFELSAPPSGRADTLLRAFGAPEAMVGRPLGSPDVLVSRARADLRRRRDNLDRPR